MKLLVINQLGSGVVKNSDFLPRVGDHVDMFGLPPPRVTSIILWPTDSRLEDLRWAGRKIDAIIEIK